MIHAVFAGSYKQEFETLEQALNGNGVDITWKETRQRALDLLEGDKKTGRKFELLLTEESPGEMDTKTFVEQVVMQNPMMHCVIISALSHEDFHEMYEGLGVLMQLPPAPDEADVRKLTERLKQVTGMMETVSSGKGK